MTLLTILAVLAILGIVVLALTGVAIARAAGRDERARRQP
jgi:type II secretory pathway pseudopilin PulG